MNRTLTKKEAPNKILNEKRIHKKITEDLDFTKNKNYTHTHKDT